MKIARQGKNSIAVYENLLQLGLCNHLLHEEKSNFGRGSHYHQYSKRNGIFTRKPSIWVKPGALQSREVSPRCRRGWRWRAHRGICGADKDIRVSSCTIKAAGEIRAKQVTQKGCTKRKSRFASQSLNNFARALLNDRRSAEYLTGGFEGQTKLGKLGRTCTPSFTRAELEGLGGLNLRHDASCRSRARDVDKKTAGGNKSITSNEEKHHVRVNK
jgi:hypothetical protein